MSPAYGTDKMRLNISMIRYAYRPSMDGHNSLVSPHQFFKIYADYFRHHGPKHCGTSIPSYTFHLGKWIDISSDNLSSLRHNYPMYDEWIKVRKEMDPNQVFVDAYWRRHFNIGTECEVIDNVM